MAKVDQLVFRHVFTTDALNVGYVEMVHDSLDAFSSRTFLFLKSSQRGFSESLPENVPVELDELGPEYSAVPDGKREPAFATDP